MTGCWEAVWFAVSVTVPSILLLVFGVALRRSGQVDAHF